MDKDRSIAIFVIGAIVLGVLGCAAGILYRKHEQTTVARLIWQRQVNLEEFKTVQHSDWSVPPTGRIQKSYLAIYGYNKVPSGSTSECVKKDTKGNCTKYEEETTYRDVPIYRTKYDYLIDEWSIIEVKINTREDHNPVWPNTEDLTEHTPPQLGDRRANNRQEFYTVIFTNNRSMRVTQSLWQSMSVGQACAVTVNILGEVKEVACGSGTG